MGLHADEKDGDLDKIGDREQEEDQREAPVELAPAHEQHVQQQDVHKHIHDIPRYDGQDHYYDEPCCQALQDQPALLYLVVWGWERLWAITHLLLLYKFSHILCSCQLLGKLQD